MRRRTGLVLAALLAGAPGTAAEDDFTLRGHPRLGAWGAVQLIGEFRDDDFGYTAGCTSRSRRRASGAAT